VTSAAQEQRAARLRQFDAECDAARATAAVMAAVVRGREARAGDVAEPLEVSFAAQGSLPAAVWVGLRSDDVDTVMTALAAASDRIFLVSEHEEMGAGYKLQKVEETRVLPDATLLLDQLAAMLAIPADVLGVLGQWGPDDPRTSVEITALLDSRFGQLPPDAADEIPPAPPASGTRPADIGLRMSVQEMADVLQLSEAQAKVLATLVRRAGVTITP
jgi:hypothetical protein